MLIVCPNCATSYQVIPDYLGDSGRPVRCVNCHHVWFEEPHRPDFEPEPAADDHWPPLQPYSRSWSTPIEGGNADFEYDTRAAHESSEYDRVRTDDPDRLGGDPYLAESREFAYAQPISHAGLESGKPEIKVETYVERLVDRRSFRRPIPSRRRRVISAKAATLAWICLLAMALSTLVAARQQVVRHLPQTASLYRTVGLPVNLRGLQLDNLRTLSELQDRVPVLVVEGDIVATSSRTTEVPRLRFAVTDRAGNEIYAWTSRADRSLLPPGEALPFRSRLASPPAEAAGVTVRFFDEHDATAELM